MIRLEDIQITTNNGKENLATCSDKDFENYIKKFFDIIESSKEWTRASRENILSQIEYLTIQYAEFKNALEELNNENNN